MLTDFLHTIVEFIQFLWPLARVQQWEEAVILVFGRARKKVGPGVYLKVPWFMEVHVTSVVWEIVTTGRSDITTRDGKALSFAASAMIRVSDVMKAVTVVHDASHAAQSILHAVLAEKLAEVDPERLSPERRTRLNSSLVALVKEECAELGTEVKWVRFTSFVLNPRTYRILSESSPFIG